MTTGCISIAYPDIPVNAVTVEPSASSADGFDHYNLYSGRRYLRGAYDVAAAQRYTQVDMGVGNTASVDHAIIGRADIIKAAGCRYFALRGSSEQAAIPVTDGLVLHLDGADLTTITSSNGLISAWNDKAGAGYHLAQATDANKPYLTRADSLENRITSSEDLTGTGWASAGLTLSPTVMTEDTSNGAHYVYKTVESVKGATYTLTFDASAGTNRNWVAVRFTDGAGQVAYFDLANGMVGTVSGPTSTSIQNLGSGVWRCSITVLAATSTGAAAIQAYIGSSDGVASYQGVSGNSINIYRSHFARTGKGYITTTTYPQYAGLNGRAVPYFPGLNSSMNRAYTAALDIGVGSNTIFAVAQLDGGADAATNYEIISTETSQTKGLIWRFAGSDLLSEIRTSQAGTADTEKGSQAAAAGALALWAEVKDGTTSYHYKNGVGETADTLNNAVSASANNFYIANGTGQGLRGYLPEVIVFNRALSAGELAQMHEYLAAKWTRTPSIQITDFQSETLYGPQSADVVRTCTASTAYRYWIAEYDSSSAQTFEHSALMFGRLLSFTKSPTWSIKRVSPADSTWQAPAGDVYSVRSEFPRYEISLTWEGETDATAKSFINNILRWKEERRFFLYSTSNHAILDNKRLIHCKLKEATVSTPFDNWNKITSTWVEEVG